MKEEIYFIMIQKNKIPENKLNMQNEYNIKILKLNWLGNLSKWKGLLYSLAVRQSIIKKSVLPYVSINLMCFQEIPSFFSNRSNWI